MKSDAGQHCLSRACTTMCQCCVSHLTVGIEHQGVSEANEVESPPF